jgi:hypothetical protein
MLGLVGVATAVAVFIGLIFARLSGTTELGPWGVVALFAALVFGVIGISIFALGVTFNYLVSMFYKRPIRQGLFGKPILKTPIDHHFGWMGSTSFVIGLITAIVSVTLSLSGWDITRLWFYMLTSAMMMLVGMELVIYWILLRVLDELSRREVQTEQDMRVNVSVT